jgi:hypothetical protein
MQRPHRRHEADGIPSPPGFSDEISQVASISGCFHRLFWILDFGLGHGCAQSKIGNPKSKIVS